MKIINRPVNRIFTFGCSFTKYFWSCWPEIVAKDLDIPLYNYGKSGAGNQYISNAISQADYFHKFSKDDLIIVSWTSVCREDRWRKGTWVNTGNIFTQSFFNEKFLMEWADPLGYMIRDLSSIKLVKKFLELKGCQFYMTSMCDIDEQIDQCDFKKIEKNSKYYLLKEMYKEELEFLLPSFFKTLWNNDIYTNKLLVEKGFYGNFFSDGHPRPLEHLKFLELTFQDHAFSNKTKDAVTELDQKIIEFFKNKIDSLKKPFAIYEVLTEKELELIPIIYPSNFTNIL